MNQIHIRRTAWAGALLLLTPALAGQSLATTPPAHVIVPQYRSFAAPHHQPVQIERVRAKVAILEQTARTTLQIDLVNPAAVQAEAIVLLPVPADAAVSGFAFDGPAKEPTARLLPADEARTTYDEIVRRMRDPGLLEFAGARLIRTSVFPIAARGRAKIELSYEHVLEADGDRVDYVLLRSEALDRAVPWEIHAEVRARSPIAMLYSPSHTIESTKQGDARFTVKLPPGEATAPGSFRLSYLRVRGGSTAASLFAYPDPKIGGGYFLLLASAPPPPARAQLRREVTLVLDRSGSMAGEKMDQARAAARQVIEALDDGELFNIIDYATSVERFALAPVEKTPETLQKARAYLASLRPLGGTNIHDALLEALRQPTHDGALPLVLFLTDGLATVGQTAERTIRDMVATGNTAKRRLFSFGVGEDVNVPLLDRIAETTRATSTYVLPREDVEVKVARVFQKLSGPVLAYPALATLDAADAVTTQRVRERYPSEVPDLFAGDSLVLLGQYREEEPLRFVLSGHDGERERTFRFEFDLARATTKNAFVPRLWASRRVADLVDQVRQAGADTGRPRIAGTDPFADPKLRELREEILRLSTEFGILTEYTSFLATEGTQLGNWGELIGACSTALHTRAWQTRSGIEALNQGINLKQFGKEQTVLNPRNGYFNDNLDHIETTNVQQVCDRAFFKRGEQWIDGRLVRTGNFTPARTIEFGSAAHASLLQRLVREGRQGTLSLDGQVLLELDGEVVLIVNDC